MTGTQQPWTDEARIWFVAYRLLKGLWYENDDIHSHYAWTKFEAEAPWATETQVFTIDETALQMEMAARVFGGLP